MANKQSYIRLWMQPKINYELIAPNGEVLYNPHQGFERIAGVKKNLKAIKKALAFSTIMVTPTTEILVQFFDSRRAKTVNKEEVWTL